VKKMLALVIVALVVPSVALAAKPNPPGNSQNSPGKAAPTVTYALKGTLTAYQATGSFPFTSPVTYTCANGYVTINITHANHHGAALKALTQPLSICLSSSTRLVVKGSGTLTVGDKGIVKLRYAKKFNPDDPTQLSAFLSAATAKQIIDQGPLTPSS
jgi:hypothetical protein